jgi:hypothetical protein
MQQARGAPLARSAHALFASSLHSHCTSTAPTQRVHEQLSSAKPLARVACVGTGLRYWLFGDRADAAPHGPRHGRSAARRRLHVHAGSAGNARWLPARGICGAPPRPFIVARPCRELLMPCPLLIPATRLLAWPPPSQRLSFCTRRRLQWVVPAGVAPSPMAMGRRGRCRRAAAEAPCMVNRWRCTRTLTRRRARSSSSRAGLGRWLVCVGRHLHRAPP